MIPSQTFINQLTYEVNGAAIEVHKGLGPGLLEDVYMHCLKHELSLRNIRFQSEMSVPVVYKGIEVPTKLRCDFLIEGAVCVEIKSVKEILPVHKAQLLTYMKLLEVPKGILYNFNVVNLFHEGQETYVNEYFRILPD